MKAKTLKIVITLLMATFTLCTFSQVVLASAASDLVNIPANTNAIDAQPLQQMAGNILGLIQIASAIAAVILIAVLIDRKSNK